jgi:hypothetical protein
MFDLSNIDLSLLHEQKNVLVESIYNDPENILWGIVELLDAITDQME